MATLKAINRIGKPIKVRYIQVNTFKTSTQSDRDPSRLLSVRTVQRFHSLSAVSILLLLYYM